MMRNPAFIFLALFALFSLSVASVPGVDETRLNNCLCRAGCEAVGWNCQAVSCSWDPEGTRDSYCSDVSKGECVCSGFGCGRASMVTSGDSYDRCMLRHGPPVCGDGTCQPDKGENCANCPADCPCAQGKYCDPTGTITTSSGLMYPDLHGCLAGKAKDQCEGIVCPSTVCDEGIFYTKISCNPATGSCESAEQYYCNYGCAPGGLECNPEPVSPRNLCEGVACPEYFCQGSTYYYDGYCEPRDGRCYHYKFECGLGCDPATNQCIQRQREANLAVSIDNPSIFVDGKSTATMAAYVSFPDGTPVQGAKVRFELSDPRSTRMLGQWGRASVEKFTDSSGYAYATFSPPDIMRFRKFEQEYFPYSIDLEVTASKRSTDADFSVSDSSRKIQLLSPLLKIESISVRPFPSQSGKNHTVSAVISDPVDSPSGYRYKFEAFQGELFYGDQRGKIIFVESPSKSTEVIWQAPKRGMSLDEFSLAKELYGVGTGLAIDLTLSGTKGSLEVARDHLAEQALKSKGSTALRSTVGFLIPVVDKGKTVYGMYGEVKNLDQQLELLARSGSGWESFWRAMDMGASGVKLVAGGINLYTGSTPVIGKFSSWTQDLIGAGIGTFQVWARGKADYNRLLQSEVKTTSAMVEVEVLDYDGPYTASDFFVYDMQYVGFKEVD